MNRMTLRTALFLALGFTALAGFIRPAQGAFNAYLLVGHWAGSSQSTMLPAVQDSFFDITFVYGRRFKGRLEIPSGEIVPCVFPIDGTFSAAGIVDGTSFDQHGHHGQFHGQMAAFGDGSVRLLTIHYHISMGLGRADDGYALYIQMMGGADWDKMAGADVNGDLRGMYFPNVGRKSGDMEGTLRNSVREAATTAIGGSMSFFDVFHPASDSFFDVFFDLKGTVGFLDPNDPSRPVPIGMIGTSPSAIGTSPGIIAILIGLLLPAVQDQPRMIQGQYMMFDSFFDVFTELSTGKNMSFNQGGFILPYIEQDN